MKINAADVARLREQTGAGIMEAKRALEQSNGDLNLAGEILRKQGTVKAEKKANRATREGLIVSYVHQNKIGVLLELNCETDFVARNENFQELANDIAMQIAAMNPFYINEEDVPPEIIAKEREIYAHQLEQEGGKEGVSNQIIEGKIAQYKEETVLLNQPFIKDGSTTIKQKIDNVVHILGENIKINRFVRFEMSGSAYGCNLELPSYR